MNEKITSALATRRAGDLWLHLVALATRCKVPVRGQVDGPCVWVGALRLTRIGNGWVAHVEKRGWLERVDAHAALLEVFSNQEVRHPTPDLGQAHTRRRQRPRQPTQHYSQNLTPQTTPTPAVRASK